MNKVLLMAAMMLPMVTHADESTKPTRMVNCVDGHGLDVILPDGTDVIRVSNLKVSRFITLREGIQFEYRGKKYYVSNATCSVVNLEE